MILLAPGDTLRATLAAAPATANPSFSFASADDGATRTLVPSKGVLNGTTPVDLVSAPAMARTASCDRASSTTRTAPTRPW
jgi:hypothetical protein